MKEKTSEPLIKFDTICYTVGKTQILDNISFEIEKSDFLSIVGPNGSGKTTLLKLILGIKKGSKGKIIFSDSNINNELNSFAIGYVPQTKTLDTSFPTTALELVANGISGYWNFRISKEQKNKTMEILEKINATHIATKQLNELSGGELQRIYLARAIIRNPKILLLDEPATGIDMVCENDINEIISKLRKENETTIIMVTHDWSSAYYHANKALLLNKNVIYFGNPQDGFTDENLLKTFSSVTNHHQIAFGIKNI
jgi:zinc transport system ATP-binding protein